MKQITITQYGPPEVLKIIEKPTPLPGDEEILIHVRASGVNFADILARQGLYLDAPKPPCVVGYEVAGVVEDCGKKVPSQWKNREVFCLTHFGGYSDYLTVPYQHVFEKPKTLSFEEAAALPVNYLTAYQLIVVMGALKKDETILIHNAGGGVGLAALEISKKIGATTIGTSSQSKHSFLKKWGLDHAIDYRNKDWVAELMKITDGKGAELIIDPIGGINWKKSYQSLRSTGRLGMFGVSTATESPLFGKFKYAKMMIQMPWFNPVTLMNENKSVFGVNMGHLWNESEKITSWAQALLNGVNEKWICPHVDKVFSFNEAPMAHRYLEERKNIGKVILIP